MNPFTLTVKKCGILIKIYLPFSYILSILFLLTGDSEKILFGYLTMTFQSVKSGNSG
jgi:hypothetical protein